jgi:hypothetical protein
MTRRLFTGVLVAAMEAAAEQEGKKLGHAKRDCAGER